MSELNSDLLPLYESSRGFDTAMRGYDREQVDREVSRLDDDLRVTAAERDSAAGRSADLAAQLASTHAQAESLRRHLQAATATVTTENVDDRVRSILNAAKADAATLRHEAQSQAEQVRNGAADSAAHARTAAQAEADRILGAATARKTEAEETFARRVAEADAYQAQAEAALAQSAARTRAEEARLSTEAAAERTRLTAEADTLRAHQDTEATAERARLDGEAKAGRDRATEDFEIALRVRRSTAAREQAEQKAIANALAATTLADAKAAAQQLIADATHEVWRLHSLRDSTHTQLDDLYGKLRSALDESLAQTTAMPDPPRSDARSPLEEPPGPA